ncbi:U3 snoRNP protein [Teratosphaeriaceae sp. CCFEE 6253]|nr:U3 snoRNP protein [Teratosphaeriaceae sp. CCFEE 6253]
MGSMTTLPLSLSDAPHAFLTPTLPLYTDTLAYLKHALDPLAADISNIQQARLAETRKKRKRGARDRSDEAVVLRVKQIHTAGFGPEEVWEQARRIIEAARKEAERGLREAKDRAVDDAGGSVAGSDIEDGAEVEDGSELGEEGVDYEIEGVDDGEEVYEGESGEDLDAALDQAEDGAGDDFEADEDDDIDMDGEINGDEHDVDEPAQELVEDKFGLNDGFFSIDDFNKQSEFLEQRDARGDGADEAGDDDEEDIDWDADISAQPTANGAASGADAADSAGEDDDEDGPTFGDPDAPSEDDDDEVEEGEMDAMGGMGNTNHIAYAEFFAPPAQKKRKNKKGRPNPHNFPAAAAAPADALEGGEDEVERTMAAVHRDLFDDEASAADEEDSAAEDSRKPKDLVPSDPRSRRSAHEKRRAALADEIRKLEAANLAKRSWTLSGEARATDRPLNSLLEEDLEFERAGKPVPVITAEVSESLEQLIKRRILAHDFQDLVRRRPGDLATGGKEGRRSGFELEDTKSKRGLAEEYEEEHLRKNDPNYVDAGDEKTRKEEQAIEALWQKVWGDLDSLSSWHFRPKAAAPNLEIRVDAPAISIEDARPAAGGEVAGASRLAPGEIYKGGEAVSGREEVAGKSGLPEAREEMGRDERKRRRRRAKERIRKASGPAPVGVQGGVEKEVGESRKGKERREVLGELKKGGVGVIGAKGKVTDVEGKEVKEGTAGGQRGGGRYKL